MITIGQIGHGGFGIVDLVENANGERLARKTFNVNQRVGFPMDLVENVKRRFVREAEVQAAISHRNIMPVIQTDLNSDPPSFVMPLAVSTLGQDMDVDRTLNGQAIAAVMDILAGLEELHSIGITHRDLKPQNVLRLHSDGEERYVISDFGLMSIKDTQLSVLTQTGMRMGSDFYTAPEIVTDLRMASASSDIYSVGCILHDFFGTGDRIPCAEISDLSHYGDIIRICTRGDRLRRFQSVSDLREAILSLDQAELTAAEPQITDLINLLASDELIDLPRWEHLVDKMERAYPSSDASALLGQVSLSRITELVVNCPPELAARFGVIYSEWVKKNYFDFAICDGIANRLQAFVDVNDISCQSEVILALLFMGTSHNRWYVERKFTSLCGADMNEALARRIAMEIRASSRTACQAIFHLERSINFDRSYFHPIILNTLNQVC